MIVPYKNRTIRIYYPVEVYRNVNKKGVWYSVRQDGKVVAHVTEISLREVKFHVGEGGRKRAKKTKRKNVHAWLTGYVTNYAKARYGKEMTRVVYDPMKYKNFVTLKDKKRVKKARTAVLYADGLIASV